MSSAYPGKRSLKMINPERVEFWRQPMASVPHISLVELDFMATEQQPKLDGAVLPGERPSAAKVADPWSKNSMTSIFASDFGITQDGNKLCFRCNPCRVDHLLFRFPG